MIVFQLFYFCTMHVKLIIIVIAKNTIENFPHYYSCVIQMIGNSCWQNYFSRCLKYCGMNAWNDSFLAISKKILRERRHWYISFGEKSRHVYIVKSLLENRNVTPFFLNYLYKLFVNNNVVLCRIFFFSKE